MCTEGWTFKLEDDDIVIIRTDDVTAGIRWGDLSLHASSILSWRTILKIEVDLSDCRVRKTTTWSELLAEYFQKQQISSP